MIGRIERMPLRHVWPHEEYDFTTWLVENIDVLSDVIDRNLQSAEREQKAGSFSVDILAEDESGNPVIVENQLEKSDHDHLGKLITYLTSFSAKTAVWIVSEPRPEHVRAVSWLNEATDVSFYLLKVEAIRIGESPPAPLITALVGPTPETREVGEVKRELKERHHKRHAFFTALLDYARERTSIHANVSPSYETWVGTGAGKSGLSFNYVINQHEGRVELYIDRGRGRDAENEAIFDELHVRKEAIEHTFGEALEWGCIPAWADRQTS